MGVGMVGAEFQPNSLGAKIGRNDMATHEILVVEEALLAMGGQIWNGRCRSNHIEWSYGWTWEKTTLWRFNSIELGCDIVDNELL